MPALIDVPKSKEQIAEFLGDGISEGVPAIQASDINDGDILNGTRTIEVGNGYKFEITLPSGRVLESAPVSSDYPKRDAILAWLGAVRDSIVEDGANAARAARDAHMAEARARDLANPPDVRSSQSLFTPAAAAASPGYTGTDPIEYAKANLRSAIERLAALSTAEADVQKWQRVVESLTGVSPVKRKKRRKKKGVKNASNL